MEHSETLKWYLSLRRIKKLKTIGLVLVIVGIIGLVVGIGAYLFITKTVEVNTVPITIEKATYYTGQTSAGFLGPKEAYYSQIQVEPTSTTKPDVDYLINTNNGIINNTYLVSWNQTELALSKAKTITDRISQDDLAALKQNSQYTVKINERKSPHNIIYIAPGILLFVLGVMLLRKRAPPPPPPPPSEEDVTLKHFNEKHSAPKSTNEAASEQRDKPTEAIRNEKLAEETLAFVGPDELAKIAKEYVQHKENISDVEIIGTKTSLIETLPIHIVEGIAKKHSMGSNFNYAIIAECSFRLWISAKDGKVIDYQPGEWVKKNVEQTSTPYSSEYVEYVEPIQTSEVKHAENPINYFEQQRLNRLLEQRKISFEEFDRVMQRLPQMSFMERQSFLSALERREDL